MALDRGKRTTLLSTEMGVNVPQASEVGSAISKFGDTALKIAENQAAIMDEIWKGDFKVKTAKFLNDLSIEQEAMAMPDLTQAQQSIIGYKEELINSSSARYKKYIENYLDLKGIDTLDTLRKRSNAIMFNNVSGAIDNELSLVVNGTYSKINKLLEDPDIIDAEGFRTGVEDIFTNAALDINDINFSTAQSLNPIDYNDEYIRSKVDSNFMLLETNRMYGIALSMFKGVDFTQPDQVALAEARVLQFKEDYISGKEKRLSNNFNQDQINQLADALQQNVETIKAFNAAAIEQGVAVANYAELVNQNKMKDAIENNSVVSAAFYANTTIDTLYGQLEALNLNEDADLIQTFMDKKQIYSYFDDISKTEQVNPNYVDTYFAHVTGNLNIDIDKDDLKEFSNSYVRNKINLANIHATGQPYTIGNWFEDLGKPINEQMPGTTMFNNLIKNHGVVDDEIQGSLQTIYNILGKGELEREDIDTITNLYQGWSYITQENPIAIANMKNVDQGFFNYVTDNGGLLALETQGPANMYAAYLKKVDLTESNSGNIVIAQNELLNDPIIMKGINFQLNAEMVDAVMKDDAITKMAMPLWNMLMKDPEFQFAMTHPLQDFVQLKEGFITGKGGDMSEMNFLQMVAIKGQQTINTIFDLVNPFDTNFMNEKFTNTFYEIRPEVQQYINQAVINQLPNFMDINEFAKDPDAARERFAEVAPDIIKTVIRNLNDDNYSLTALGSRNGNLQLVKFGYETAMAEAGYNEDDMMTRTALDIGVILKGYEVRNDKDFMFDEFGFLYRDDEGKYREPSLQDIKDSLANGDFAIVPEGASNLGVYQVYINAFDSSYRNVPLGAEGEEKIVIEPFDPNKIDPYATPISKKQIMDKITMDLVNNPDSMFNQIPGFSEMNEGMKKFTVQFLTQPQYRMGTETFLEPFIEFITGGRYDYRSVQDQINQYIEEEYKKGYQDQLD